MSWLIALGILVLLALTPLGVHVRYQDKGVVLKLIIGLLKIQLLPDKGKKKQPKPEKQTEKQPKQPIEKYSPSPEPGSAETTKTEKKGGSFTDFLPLLQIALDFLGDFRRKLRVNCLEMKLVMAGGDPCNLAIQYGKAWAALGNLLPLLEQVFVIQKRDLQVECDFIGASTTIYVRLDLTITFGRLLYLVVRYGFRAVKELLTIRIKRKGGASL